ncbi:MAG: VWA domain-containing protein [Bacteroidales bacterium]
MFRFANPYYLYLLLALPVLVAFYLSAVIWKRKALKKYGNPELLATLMPEVSYKRQHWKFWLLFGAVTLIVFVIAGPQFGSKLETVKRQGVEIMVCLDVSNSMLAEDMAPNRLGKAKQMLSRLTDGFVNDKVGLIVFAGDAFTQLPITSDYISAKMFLSSINPSMVSSQGTAIGAAINLAVRSFTPNEVSGKTIVLITDGENHEDDAVGAARKAAEKGIHVNIVGMGQPNGSPIPVGSNNDFLKDREGNVVVTKLNEQMCQDIAAAGEGMYIRADNTNSALKAIQNEINKMTKSELDSRVYSEYDEQFQTLAWLALFLLIAEFLTLDRKSRLFRKINLFSVLLLCAGVTFAQKAERKNVREGNKLYSNEKYTESEIAYRKSIEVNPRSIEGTYNLGNALYKQEKYPEAAEQYRLLAGQAQKLLSDNPANAARLAQTFHNLGNISMKNKEYAQSVEAYKQSLRLNPRDDETRYNLALAQKLLNDQQSQSQEQNQNKDQQKQDKKDEQQQPQQDDQKENKTQEERQPNEQMSQDNAQQILDAFLQDEKDTQEKVKKAQAEQQKRRRTDKEW